MVKPTDARFPLVTPLPPPEVIGLLPDVKGGETNLLPEALTRANLKVWFTVADHSDPTLSKEKVELFVDADPNPVSFREWTTPISDTDRYIELTSQWLRNNDGEHRLRYKMTIYNGSSEYSSDLVMTLDTRAPILASNSRLIFPPEILPPNKLTARYLEADDQVKADLPAYVSPRPWDRITWYWGTTPGNTNQGGVIVLDDQNYAAPVVVTVPGSFIRARGDGLRYVWYQVQDRAGNLSLRADPPVELDVAATPIPRVLPPVKVSKASGGTSSGVMNPYDAINGLTVTIPPQAVINEGERTVVYWAEPGTEGAFRTETPTAPGSRSYLIPKDKMAPHLGKTLPVKYDVSEEGVAKPHVSDNYSLRFQELTGLPIVQCDKVSAGKLSLATLTTGFADFTLGSWAFMGTEQFITVTVVGVDKNSGKQLEIPALPESPVPEVAGRIAVGRISKTDLQRFRLDAGFEVKVKVSFDNKQTWKNFPELRPTLVA